MTNEQIIQNMIYTAKLKGFEGYVLVEDFGDIAFWNGIFTKIKTDFNGFFNPYHSGKSFFMKEYAASTKQDFILCVDSDNCHKYKNNYENLFTNRAKFFFHTYTHSRENHLAHVKSLQHWLKNTLNENGEYLNKNLSDLSQIVKEVFLFYTLNIENQDFKHFLKENNCNITIEKLKEIIDLSEDLEEINELSDFENTTFSHLKNKLNAYCQTINRLIEENYRTDYFEELRTLENRLEIDENDYLFFLQGHIVEDNILKPLFEKIMDCAIEKQSIEIDGNTKMKDKEARKNQLQKLKHKTLDNNFCFLNEENCKYLQLVFQDVRNDFGI